MDQNLKNVQKKECFNNSPAFLEEVFSKYFPEKSEADSGANHVPIK